jgi:ureidoglycolate lyase
MTPAVIMLQAEKLSATAFADFGDVIETVGHAPIGINQGFADRFNDLARVDVGMEGGTTNISVIVGQPRPMPLALQVMERHPLGSQIFFPLQDRPWLVVVCSNPDRPESYRAFAASGQQGVNYARNSWHHPLLVLEPESRFLVVDRKGGGQNLEEHWLDPLQPLQFQM